MRSLALHNWLVVFSNDDPSILPSGVLTVMFTDLEDSTALWELDADEMRRVMNVHDEILSRVVAAHDGVIFKSTGDGVGAVFVSPSNAFDAAIVIQRQLQMVPWRSARPRVRIGMHLGEISPTRADYYGAAVNRAARIMDVANGDQIAVSDAVAAYVGKERLIAVGQHELRGIGAESIHLVLDGSLIRDDRPMRARVVRRRKLLPASATRSIGREHDVDAIVSLLERRRLVTVTGPGGVGKTHVALAVGRKVEHRYRDGAVLVELDALRDGDDVADAVASAIGARVQPDLDLLESIVDFVHDRELLLILDNCEHVAASAAPLIQRLVDVPELAIIATSRASLGITDEQAYPIAPLDAASGIDLFIDRATSRDPGFAPSAEDLRHIAAIRTAADGIPLAIELAAAWVRVLSLEDIAQRLGESVDVARSTAERPQFDTVSSASAASVRHETLQKTIEWSYVQLAPNEALLFDRLSVFVGGFSIDAVEEVCVDHAGTDRGSDLDMIARADIPALLMALLDKSMILAERRDDRPRFAMLKALQMFGADSLARRGESTMRALRHAEYVARSVTAASERLVTHEEPEVWEFFDLEWSNIRQAFTHLRASGRHGDAAQILLDLGWYATLSLRSEAFAWADELLLAPEVNSLEAHSSLLGLRAIHKYFSVDPGSRSDAERGLAIDPSDPYGYCRIALGAVWVKNQHEPRESEGWTRDWLGSLVESSPAMSRLWAQAMRAFHLCVHDPASPEALARVETIEQVASDTGSTSAQALARWSRGMYAASGRSDGRAAALDDWWIGRELTETLSAMHLVAHLITSLELHFTAEGGDLERALELCRDALARSRDHHYLVGATHLFGVTTILLARVGRADLGAQLFPVMVASGDLPRKNAVDALADASGEVDPVRVVDGWSPGRPLTIDEAARVADMALAEALERCRS